MAGITLGKHLAAMFFQNAPSHHLRRTQNPAMRDRTAKRCTQRDHGSDIDRSLRRDGARDNASQAMTDQVHLLPGPAQRLLDRIIQLALNKQIGTFRVEADS